MRHAPARQSSVEPGAERGGSLAVVADREVELVAVLAVSPTQSGVGGNGFRLGHGGGHDRRGRDADLATDQLRRLHAAGVDDLNPGRPVTVDFPLAGGGGQWEIDRHWTAGVQVIDASGVKTPELVGGEFGLTAAPVVAAAVTKTESVSTYAGLGWRNGEDRDQLNFAVSDNGQGPAALGAWFDGTLARGRVTQNYGAFRLQPNLSWGYLPISNDTEGVYYRAAYRGQQWLFDGGVDSARSISGAGVGGTLFNGDVRYQFDPTTGVGAGDRAGAVHA